MVLPDVETHFLPPAGLFLFFTTLYFVTYSIIHYENKTFVRRAKHLPFYEPPFYFQVLIPIFRPPSPEWVGLFGSRFRLVFPRYEAAQ